MISHQITRYSTRLFREKHNYYRIKDLYHKYSLRTELITQKHTFHRISYLIFPKFYVTHTFSEKKRTTN